VFGKGAALRCSTARCGGGGCGSRDAAPKPSEHFVIPKLSKQLEIIPWKHHKNNKTKSVLSEGMFNSVSNPINY